MAYPAEDSERAPLVRGGEPRDYNAGGQKLQKTERSPLRPVLGDPPATSEYPVAVDPFSLNADTNVATISDFGRTRQASDAVSVTSFGGTLTTSVANEGDLQNLQDVLISLEKASTLIKGYIHQEERLKKK